MRRVSFIGENGWITFFNSEKKVHAKFTLGTYEAMSNAAGCSCSRKLAVMDRRLVHTWDRSLHSPALGYIATIPSVC